MRRRRTALVLASCRFRDEDGARCNVRIPAGQALCELHKAESATVAKARRRWRREETFHRRREREIRAYREKLDPGSLVNYEELLA